MSLSRKFLHIRESSNESIAHIESSLKVFANTKICELSFSILRTDKYVIRFNVTMKLFPNIMQVCQTSECLKKHI
jgi:hypothetical protein